ncbi:MAG: hypothetical protein N3F66_14630 [Spirochaetes bacterium]|nr:hypothetical protein [Spirochaetota bacterium]
MAENKKGGGLRILIIIAIIVVILVIAFAVYHYTGIMKHSGTIMNYSKEMIK